jgi:hypothetical protein
MFDPRDPYERYYWHYESRRPLSMAQIIAMHSVDAHTVALIWLLMEHGASLTVAGPTDPQPGVGKTTTLNALLQFLPEGTALAYMSGMYENFAFTRLPDVDPATTYALCNEVSDHLPIYMWGRIAKRYLTLPAQGYHVATSVHADTIDEVIYMYHRTLHLNTADMRHLGLIVNIGLVGQIYPPRRRWFTTHFVRPIADPQCPEAIIPVKLSSWNEDEDTFTHADRPMLDELAAWIGMDSQSFSVALANRTACLESLAYKTGSGRGVTTMPDMFEAISDLRQQEAQAS